MRLRSSARLAAAAGLAAGVLSGCGQKQELKQLPGRPTPLVVSLDGPPGAVTAPLYGAGARGDFTRAGLAVTLVQAADGSRSLAKLASGAVSLAVSSEPDLLIARARGEQLISIGALEQGPLEAVISIPPKPIASVAGLAGKTVATVGTRLSGAELDTMLRTAGVQSADVRRTVAQTDPTAPLRSHAADATLGGRWNTDAILLGLERRTPSVIRIAAAGVPTFNDEILVVRLADARKHGDVLRTFLQALTQAVHAAQSDPAQTVAAVLAAVPGLDRRFELVSLEATLPALDPPDSRNPFGYQNPAVWRTFASWMLTNGLLSVRSDAALAVDDEFLPGQGE